MSNNSSILHTILSPAYVLSFIRKDYALKAESCQLLCHGINDTYLLHDMHGRYIVKLYRTEYKSIRRLHFEARVLAFLQENGILLAAAVANGTDNSVHRLKAPDGERLVMLYEMLEGNSLPMNPNCAALLGKSTAYLHTVSRRLTIGSSEQIIDMPSLIDGALQALKPIFQQYPDDWSYIMELAHRTQGQILGLSKGLDWGFCHGDIYAENAHIVSEGKIALFDFDFCGYSWRMYDLAVFRLAVALEGHDPELWEYFIQGYTSVRELSEADIGALPSFVVVRYLWIIALKASHTDVWPFELITEEQCNQVVTFLRLWDEQHM